MGTDKQDHPETLLAWVDTAFTDLVILPPAILTQEERPFLPPFFTPAHRSFSSGDFLWGAAFSEGLRSVHSFWASARRSMMEDFFSVYA